MLNPVLNRLKKDHELFNQDFIIIDDSVGEWVGWGDSHGQGLQETLKIIDEKIAECGSEKIDEYQDTIVFIDSDGDIHRMCLVVAISPYLSNSLRDVVFDSILDASKVLKYPISSILLED